MIIMLINLDKKLAIFDLDETLIHCKKTEIEEADCMVTITLPSGKQTKVLIIPL